MPKPISWQSRLREMHRQVNDSSRTPYTPAEIGRLFRVGGAAARKLVQLMPRIEQGNSAVVERQELLDFLGQCLDAEDLSAHLAVIRAKPPKPSKRRLRFFIPREFDAGNLLSRSPTIRLQRNEATILFSTLSDFAAQLHQLVMILENPDFERRYCTPPEPTGKQDELTREAKFIRAHNRYLVKVAAAQTAVNECKFEAAQVLRSEADQVMAEIRELAPELEHNPDEILTRAADMLAALFPPAP